MRILHSIGYPSSFATKEDEEFYHSIQTNVLSKPLTQLIEVLASVEVWPSIYPAYLNDWIDILDYFDQLLEVILQRYEKELVVMKIPMLVEEIEKRRKSMKEKEIKENIGKSYTRWRGEKEGNVGQGEEDVCNEKNKDKAMIQLQLQQLTIEQANQLIYLILRFTSLLLENAARKQLYNSFEHIIQLLASNNKSIAFLALKILMLQRLPAKTHCLITAIYAAKNPSHYKKALVPLLYQILTIDDVDEIEDIGFYECLSKSPHTRSKSQESKQHYFRFHRTETSVVKENDKKKIEQPQSLNVCESKTEKKDTSDAVTILLDLSERNIPMERYPLTVSHHFINLVKEHGIPEKYHFMLFRKITGVILEQNKEVFKCLLDEKLMALTILLSLDPPPTRLNMYIDRNPELWDDIGKLIMVEHNKEISFSVRSIAVYALLALLREVKSERINGIAVNQNMLFTALWVNSSSTYSSVASILQYCITQIETLATGNRLYDGRTKNGAVSKQDDTFDMGIMLGKTFVQATDSNNTQSVASANKGRDVRDSKTYIQCIRWTECLLLLTQEVISFGFGASALTNNGLLPSLLGVLEHSVTSPELGFLMALCSGLLGQTIGNCPSALSIIKELDGISLLGRRLHDEVTFVLYQHNTKVDIARKAFILSILNALCAISHAQRSASSSAYVSSLLQQESKVNQSLFMIFNNPLVFGNSIYAQSMNLVSDLLNSDATSAVTVHSTGLATSMLSQLKLCVSVDLNSQLIFAIPTLLGALCLASDKRSIIASYKPFSILFDAILQEKYTRINKEHCHSLASIVGGNIEELLRHVPELRSHCIDECTNALKRVYDMGKCFESENIELSKYPAYNFFLISVCNVTNILQHILPRAGFSALVEWKGSYILLSLYPLILPKNRFITIEKTENTNAIQSLMLAMKAIGSRQPLAVLEESMLALDRYFSLLFAAKSALSWNQTSSSISTTQFEFSIEQFVHLHLINDTKPISEAEEFEHLEKFMLYLRCIQWLCSLLSSIVQDAQNHSQSRRWQAQFTSSQNQLLLKRLLVVEQSGSWDNAIIKYLLSKAEISLNDRNKLVLTEISSTFTRCSNTIAQFFSMVMKCFFTSGRLLEISDEESSPSMELVKLLLGEWKGSLSLFSTLAEEENQFTNKHDHSQRKVLYAASLFYFMDICFSDKNQSQMKTHLLVAFFCDADLVSVFRSSLSMVFHEAVECEMSEKISNIGARKFWEICHFLNKIASCRKKADLRVLKRILDQQKMKQTVTRFIKNIHKVLIEEVLKFLRSESFKSASIREVVVPIITSVMHILACKEDEDYANEDLSNFHIALGESNKQKTKYKLDEDTVNALTSMGFTRAHACNSLRAVGSNCIEAAMDWLLSHPMTAEDKSEDCGDHNCKADESKQKEDALAAVSYNDLETTACDVLLQCLFEESNKHHLSRALVSYKTIKEESILEVKAIILLFSKLLVGLFKNNDEKSAERSSYVQKILTKVRIPQVQPDLTSENIDTNLVPMITLLTSVCQNDLGTRVVLVKEHYSFLESLCVAANNICNSCNAEIDAVVVSCVSLFDTLAQSPNKVEKETAALFSPPEYFYFAESLGEKIYELVIHLLSISNLDYDILLASLSLCAKLTLDYEVVKTASIEPQQVLHSLLSLITNRCQDEAFLSLVATVCIRLCEDPATLQRQMENSIIEAMKRLNRRYDTRISPRSLMSELQRVAARHPPIFLQAINSTVDIQKATTRSRVFLQLKITHPKCTGKVRKSSFVAVTAHTFLLRLIESETSQNPLCVIALVKIIAELAVCIPFFGNALLSCKLTSTEMSVLEPEIKTLPNPIVGFFLVKLFSRSNDRDPFSQSTELYYQANRLLVAICENSHDSRMLFVNTIMLLFDQMILKSESRLLDQSKLSVIGLWAEFILLLLDPKGNKRNSNIINYEVARLLMDKKASKTIADMLSLLDLSSSCAIAVAQMLLRIEEILTRSLVCDKIKKCTRKQMSLHSSIGTPRESSDDIVAVDSIGATSLSQEEVHQWHEEQPFHLSNNMEDVENDDNRAHPSSLMSQRSNSMGEENDAESHGEDDDESTDEGSQTSSDEYDDEDQEEEREEENEDDGHDEEIIEFVEDGSDHDDASISNENLVDFPEEDGMMEQYDEESEDEHISSDRHSRMRAAPTPQRLGHLLENIASLHSGGDTTAVLNDIFRSTALRQNLNGARSNPFSSATQESPLYRALFFSRPHNGPAEGEQTLQSQIDDASEIFESNRRDIVQERWNAYRTRGNCHRQPRSNRPAGGYNHPIFFSNRSMRNEIGENNNRERQNADETLPTSHFREDPIARAITSSFPHASLRLFMSPDTMSNRPRRGGLLVHSSDRNSLNADESDREEEREHSIAYCIDQYLTSEGILSNEAVRQTSANDDAAGNMNQEAQCSDTIDRENSTDAESIHLRESQTMSDEDTCEHNPGSLNEDNAVSNRDLSLAVDTEIDDATINTTTEQSQMTDCISNTEHIASDRRSPDDSTREEDIASRGNTDNSSAAADASAGIVCPPGVDREVFESLPEQIRAEILETERQEELQRQRQSQDITTSDRNESENSPPAVAEDLDNATFLASLTPDLREEVLITSEDAFLRTLPPAIQAEAQILRERAATHFHGLAEFIREDTNTSSRLNNVVFSVHNARHGNQGTETQVPRISKNPEGTIVLSKEHKNDFFLDEKHVDALVKLVFVVRSRPMMRLIANFCESQCWRPVCLQILLNLIKKVAGTHDFHHHTTQSKILMAHMLQYPSKNLYHKLLSLMSHLVISKNNRIALYLMSNDERSQNLGKPSDSRLCTLIQWATSPSSLRSTSNLSKVLSLLNAVVSPMKELQNLIKDNAKLSLRPSTDDCSNIVTNESRRETLSEKKAEDSSLISENGEGKEIVSAPRPLLSQESFQNLLSILLSDMCNDAVLKQLLCFIERISLVEDNRVEMATCIIHSLEGICSTVSENLRKLNERLNLKTTEKLKHLLQNSEYTIEETRFYRLLKALACVLPTTDLFIERCQHVGLTHVWDVLSKVLHSAMMVNKFEKKDPASKEKNDSSIHVTNITTRFLPLIEAFFIATSHEASKIPIQMQHRSMPSEGDIAAATLSSLAVQDNAQKATTPSSPMKTNTTSESNKTMTYVSSFVEQNRTLLNLLVRHNPSLLESSLACLVKYSGCRAFLDFDNKRTYFQIQMKKLRASSATRSVNLRLQVRRSHIFEDSFNSLRMRTAEEMRRKLHVTFYHEEGIDAGGVTREFYVVLAREMFNPNYALFINTENSPIFQPNPLSYVNRQHLDYFKFVGRIIGKAICDGQLLDAHFTRSFYKHILGIPISYHDMEAIDPEYYRHLHRMLDEDIKDYGIELTFSTEKDHFGKIEIIDLVPGGRHIAVTNENKMEYIKLITHYRMTTAIKEQIKAFLDGFYELVSKELISLFNENELELLISGMPEIDIDDLRANTEYVNYKSTDQVVQWFWKCLYDFSHEERALFLQFVTGTSKVPLDGFKALVGMRGTQKFSIHKAYMNYENMLPSAHTCFNQLDLPEYKSETQLQERLLLAIREGSEGFGFG